MTEEWPWYADYDNVVTLAHWLREERGFDAAELLSFLDKPWHYESEWQLRAARIAEEERADALAKEYARVYGPEPLAPYQAEGR
jgi:hypothetical protein